MNKKIFVLLILAVFVMFMGFCDTTPPVKYTLTVEVVDIDGNAAPERGDATLSPSGGSYSKGEKIELKAEPASGYGFVEWRDESGEEISSDQTFDYTMPENDVTIKLVFNELRTITVSIVDDSGTEQTSWGSVTPGTGQYAEGSTVQFISYSIAGTMFVEWRDDANQTIGTSTTLNYTVGSEDETIYAVFDDTPPSFTLTNHDNTQVSLSDLDGNYIMITFSAGWCGYCHQQADYMDTVYNDLDTTHGVTNFINVVILIQGNGSSPATLADIQSFQSSYPYLNYVLMDNNYSAYNNYDKYVGGDFGGLPSNVILRPLAGGGFEYVDFWAGAYPTASGLISALQSIVPDMFN